MDPHKTSSNTSIPILAISVIGILTTAILLLSYYVFVIKCCRNWRRSTDAVARHQHPPLLLRSTAAEGRGLAEPAIRAIPTFRYRTNVVKSSSSHECAVCLNEFQEGERLRLLPSCLHVFHIDCIDAWLQSNANCPVCRAEITATSPLPLMAQQSLRLSGSVVIQVRDEATELDDQQQQCRPSSEQALAGKKLVLSSSMGDECIDARRAKDEHFSVQPIRRSFSMDSSSDRQLYIAVQQIMQQNPPHFQEAGSSSSAGRIRRSFFSFGHGRSLRKGVLPIEIDL